jgi:hypothetical protein
MNSYLVNYQFRGHAMQVGTYCGRTASAAVEKLEKAGAIIYSIILTGTGQ